MRALISVSDKTGIVELAKYLNELNVEIISTGGTYNVLKEHLPVTEVSELTGFKECLDGRVKTLHPVIHAGILAKRDNLTHMEQLEQLDISPIDFVIVNLYPFKKVVLNNPTFEEAIENIDIGGPTMLRAAAKNYQDVVVIVDPKDYELVVNELKNKREISLKTRYYLMTKVFNHTAAYDALISKYFQKDEFTEELTLVYEKAQDLRYGENPHQKAAFYKDIFRDEGTLANAIQHNGKELSFNNFNDTNGALELLKEFDEPTVVASKHGNPCGVGSGENINIAWDKAFNADRTSIFGGVVVFNREINLEVAKEMNKVFLEVIVAPSYEKEALELLSTKKNLRILEIQKGISEKQSKSKYDVKRINGGILIQSIDDQLIPEDIKVVTKLSPTPEQMEDLLFAMKVVKFVKSNGIVLAKNKQSIGIGPGQVNRIWAAEQSIAHAKELISDDITQGSVLASDAFFPFDDVVEVAGKAGVKAIIQPGGSIRDLDSINKCDELGIAMIFTGMRHFKH